MVMKVNTRSPAVMKETDLNGRVAYKKQCTQRSLNVNTGNCFIMSQVKAMEGPCSLCLMQT